MDHPSAGGRGPAVAAVRRPWEAWVVCAIHLGLIGFVSPEVSREPFALVPAGALAYLLVSLALGSSVGWWTNLLVAALFTIGTGMRVIDDLQRFGLRWHPLLNLHRAWLAVSLAAVGLLLSVRFRKAYTASPVLARGVTPPLRTVATCVAGLLSAGVLLLVLLVPVATSGHRVSNDRNASGTLKTLATAEADFRANDRDNNRINDFWTGDVQGLFAIVPPGATEPIKLLEPSLALADSDPLQGVYPPMPGRPSMKAGYWYWALLEDRSTLPPSLYRSGSPDPHRATGRFGFITYPNDPIAGGQSVFIVNEANILYRRPLGGREVLPSRLTPPGRLTAPGFTHWPSDEELQASWSRLD
jgi:hypothetical protein